MRICTECGDELHKAEIPQADSIALSKISYYYDGKAKTPGVIVKAGSTTLKKGTDYTVTYPAGRKAPGTYQVKVTFKGNYKGTHTLTYRILNSNMKKVNRQLASLKEGSEVSGSEFGKLKARVKSATAGSLTIRWNKVKGATGYTVYGKPCGVSKGYKKIKTFSNGKVTTYTQKNLKKASYYRYIVVAYGNENGDEVILSTSKAVHGITAGGKVANTKAVTVPKRQKKMTVKTGKTKKLRAKRQVPAGKKSTAHRNMSYESSNKKVATVSASGKIKGIKKGKATIYCYAHDGIFTTVKVTVK